MASLAHALCILLGVALLSGYGAGQNGTAAPTVVWCDWNTLDWVASKAAVLAWNATTGPGFGNGGLRFHAVQQETQFMNGINDWGLWVTADLAKKAGAACDTYILGGSVSGFFDAGQLEDLTHIVYTDSRFRWEQVSFPTRRFVAEYDSKVIAIPLTVEFPVLFYRRDFVPLPPNTWEEAIDVASKLNGTDLNGDGAADFGFCVDPASDFGRQALGIVASVMKFAVGVRQGYMYDISDLDTEPMRPVFASKGYAYALNISRRMLQLSPPGLWTTNRWETVTGLWERGGCALYLTWSGEGGAARRAERNYITGRMGTARMPGSTLVYSREADALLPCDLNLCPYMEYGGVNRPSLQSGGNRFVVRANPRNLNATVDMILTYVAAIDPRRKDSVPIRENELSNVSYYVAGGWNADDAAIYLAALKDTAVSLHMVLFVPIPTFESNWRLFAEAIRHAARIEPYEASTLTDLEIAHQLQQNVLASDTAAGFAQGDLEKRYRNYYRLPQLATKAPEVRLVWILVPVALLFIILVTVTFVSIAHSVRRQTLAREREKEKDRHSSSKPVGGGESATAIVIDHSDDDLSANDINQFPSNSRNTTAAASSEVVVSDLTPTHPSFVQS